MSTSQQQPSSNSPSAWTAPSTSTSTSSSPPSFEFTSLTPKLHIHRPTPVPKNAKPPTGHLSLTPPTPPPRLILILGWMNAPLRLVTKYAQPYSTLFPSSTILVLLSTSKGYLSDDGSIKRLVEVMKEEAGRMEGRSRMREEMMLVENRKEDLTLDGDTRAEVATQGQDKPPELAPAPRGVVIHSFSDGGASNLSHLLDQIQHASPSSSSLSTHLPPRALIMDSSPSLGSAWTGSNAFTLSLGNPNTQPWLVRVIVRRVARLAVYLFLLVARFWVMKVRGRKSRAQRVRDHLNEAKAWGKGEGEKEEVPPRLYLYSKSDALIPYRDVEAHAREVDSRVSPIEAEDKGGDSSSSSDKKQGDDDNGKSEATSSLSSSTSTSRVRLVRWQTAQHCAMARQDPEGYWNHVRRFLKDELR